MRIFIFQNLCKAGETEKETENERDCIGKSRLRHVAVNVCNLKRGLQFYFFPFLCNPKL